MSLVVVEGGPKAVRRYIKLMTKRIKWGSGGGDDDDGDDSGGSDGEVGGGGGGRRSGGNFCDLVWLGRVAKRAFTSFKFQEVKSARAARRVMEARGVAHYWDMVERGDQLDAAAALPF